MGLMHVLDRDAHTPALGHFVFSFVGVLRAGLAAASPGLAAQTIHGDHPKGIAPTSSQYRLADLSALGKIASPLGSYLFSRRRITACTASGECAVLHAAVLPSALAVRRGNPHENVQDSPDVFFGGVLRPRVSFGSTRLARRFSR